MAHKKAVSATRNGRDSNAKRRGVKAFGSTRVQAGNIIIRQKGNKYYPGEGVGQGNDYTLYALSDGVVTFYEKRRKRFDGNVERKTYVKVVAA